MEMSGDEIQVMEMNRDEIQVTMEMSREGSPDWVVREAFSEGLTSKAQR